MPTITEESELNSYNAYVIQLTFREGDEEQSIYAFRYIKGAWLVNNTAGKNIFTSMQNNQLVVKIDQSTRFQITPYIDFIQYKSGVYIADIKRFEKAMNFNDRLVEKKAEAITALGQSAAMSSEESIKLTNIIGEDKRMMRQLASVLDKQYYSNEVWLRRLKQAADSADNWLIQFDSDGKILIEENKEYVKELLTLLQNKRVKTVVDDLIFDVEDEFVAI
ncbi:TPA: Kiwa anti-phage protein KwaB-like domain-containing protein [Photobacterium damselae]